MRTALLNEILGIEYPMIQGAMAQISNGRFAAAVSNAGSLGIIAAGGLSSDQVREQIREARSLTDKPFGVNVMLMAPDVESLAAMLIEEKVPVITTGAGNPAAFISGWKQVGSKVIPVVPSVALAQRMEKAGADAVVAEGTESGGHVGELTTMALVPQVVDAVAIPVIAAGGIASGRQLCAAFALGACGAQMGTALLVSEECPVHENYKQALLSAKDISTVVTGRTMGAPVRVLKNQMAREYVRLEKEAASRDELEALTMGSLRRAVFEGDRETGSFMAGQVAGQLESIRPLKIIFESIMQEYRMVVEGLPIL